MWGDIRSVVEMECVWNLEMRIFRRRGWNSGVSPNRYRSLSVSRSKSSEDNDESFGAAKVPRRFVFRGSGSMLLRSVH